MSDRFMGAWRVTEYVYDPDGTYAGQLQQWRELLQLGDGKVRVVQRCEVSAELTHHPMSAFAGEWVFDLSIDGPQRHYHGPDVLGAGYQWAEGVMTGRGRWPRFGHDFVSFGFLDDDGVQITGGLFHDAGVPFVRIVGVAHEVKAVGDWPQLPLLELKSMAKSDGSLAAIVGDATYQVWVAMLGKLGPDGRTHRIAPLVAGMLTYAAECASATQGETPLADALLDQDEVYDADSVPRALRAATRQLFDDANVAALRRNAKGSAYSVLDAALEEFVHWYDMPWEW
jgi:hypothetical protein